MLYWYTELGFVIGRTITKLRLNKHNQWTDIKDNYQKLERIINFGLLIIIKNYYYILNKNLIVDNYDSIWFNRMELTLWC